MQKTAITISLFVGVLIILSSIFFVFDFKTSIYNYFSGMSEEEHKMSSYRLLNFIVIFLVMVISAIIGNQISKQKKRNQTLWTILCLIFNIWAVITLWFLPDLTKRRISSENE